MVNKWAFFLVCAYTLCYLQAEEVEVDAKMNTAKPVLRLEAFIKGPNTLYPGQRTTLVYRYYFSGDIVLTLEKLPLLDAEGLIKIGEKEIQDSSQDTLSITEIAQQVEAVKPGTFLFGPSRIEGYAHKEEGTGNALDMSHQLSSEAPPIEVTVMPFPEQNQPASFNGAVGNFSFKSSLLSPTKMTLGAEVSLSLEISGTGNIKNVTMPNLCCQTGFSGFFRLSDLPPSEKIEGNTKKIVTKFRVLNAQAKAIPSIEFSFFNPDMALYTILNSLPIPISVKVESQLTEESLPFQLEKSLSNEALSLSKIPVKSAPDDIEGMIPLTTTDLYNEWFGSFWALAVLPLGMALLVYQNLLKNYLAWQRSLTPLATSQELFLQSFSEESLGKCNFDRLEKAFTLALIEAHPLIVKDIPDQKNLEGLKGDIKAFWSMIDEKRFAGKALYDVGEIHHLASDLMNKIKMACKRIEEGIDE